MDASPSPKADDALANLAAQADRLPGPYLITGAQAAYIYHRWLLPIAKVVNVRIPEGNAAYWRTALMPPWTVVTQTPSLSEVRPATRVAILESYLSEALHQRRVMRGGLAFISPEDLGMQLLATATTQIALSEIAALLIARRDTLDWRYLLHQTGSSQMGQRLVEIVRAINREAGRPLLQPDLVSLAAAPPSGLTPIRPETLADLLRPLRAQWKLAHAPSTGG